MFKYTCLALLGCVAMLGQPIVMTTGVVGIAAGQTAQVNVLNPGVQPPALGVVCNAGITLVDDNGFALKSTTVAIPPGASKALQLRSDIDLNLSTTGDRKQIRAVVASPSFAPAAPSASACKLLLTLEILDTVTGRTLVTLSQTAPVPGVLATPLAHTP